MYVKVGLTILLKLIHNVCTYNILMVFPTYAPSHYFLGNALGKGLANAGHEVTMVSPFIEKNPPKNGRYKEIVLSGAAELLVGSGFPSWFQLGSMNLVQNEIYLNNIGNLITNYTLSHPKFQKLLYSKENFDVIILEQFVNDALKILSCHYKVPLISFGTLGASIWNNPIVGNPSPPSYIPDIFVSYNNKMNLWERTMNSLLILFKYLYRELRFLPQQAKIAQKYFPSCSKDFKKFFYNVSLTMLNSHESTNDPVPLVPSMIQIGGFHLNPAKKLPKELQAFMDEAKEGVVYFSFGSNITPSLINNSTKKDILRALGKLKQKVLWKWDEDELPGKPINVRLGKWFPQQDILAHSNTKLFITHGGLLSLMETVYHGVPIIALPVFGDQRLNAARMEASGYGLTIWLEKLTEEKLTNALKKLLNDSKYIDNVKTRSSLLRDRPIKPMDLAIYWTEYVIRNKGASHLRVKGLDLVWYQYLLIDVIILITVSIISMLVVVYYISKWMVNLFITSNKIKIS